MSVFGEILQGLQEGQTYLETYGRHGDRLARVGGPEIVAAVRRQRRVFAELRRELEASAAGDSSSGAEGPGRRAPLVGLFFRPEETTEFLVATFAAIAERFTVVPFYPNWDAATQLRYLLLYQVRFIAVGEAFDRRVSGWGDQHFDRVIRVSLDGGEEGDASGLPELSSIFPTDLPAHHPCAWIFTSGTSGKCPKCTVISHRNIIAAVENIRRLDFLKAGMTLHSPLSTSHIFAFVVVLGILAIRPRRLLFSDIQYLARLPQERIGKIDALILVPIVLNRLRSAFYERLIRGKSGESARRGVKLAFRGMLKRCVRLAEEAVVDIDSRRLRGLLKSPAVLVSRLFFGRAVPRRLGSPDFVVVGGAKPNVHAMAFLDALGVRCLQGWGMTETTGPLAVCTLRDRYRGAYGTCGGLFDETRARLDEGELIIEGPQVAEGYVEPGGTFVPFHGVKRTGDSAVFDRRGRLKILGKINDRVTLANGLNYNPLNLEEIIAGEDLRLSNLLDEVVIVGEGQQRLGCVFFLREPEKDGDTVLSYLAEIVKQVNRERPVDEQVGPWTIHPVTLRDSGFLGPSGKLRRPLVEEKYGGLFQSASRGASHEKVEEKVHS